MEQKAVDVQRAKVSSLAQELIKDQSSEELQAIWCRLPDVPGKAPAGQQALASRIALKLIDLGDEAPKDLKKFIADVKPVREFELKSKTPAATPAANDDKPKPQPDDEGEESMRTSTHTSKRGSLPAGARAKQALQSRKAARKTASGANSGAARGAHGKVAQKSAGRRADGPRENTITGMIVKLTKAGQKTETIAHAVAKAYPKSVFAKEVGKEDFHSVRYYQRGAEERGWLPKSK